MIKRPYCYQCYRTRDKYVWLKKNECLLCTECRKWFDSLDDDD